MISQSEWRSRKSAGLLCFIPSRYTLPAALQHFRRKPNLQEMNAVSPQLAKTIHPGQIRTREKYLLGH